MDFCRNAMTMYRSNNTTNNYTIWHNEFAPCVLATGTFRNTVSYQNKNKKQKQKQNPPSGVINGLKSLHIFEQVRSKIDSYRNSSI